jgi:GR25 family glycosyltransferase involved in LPS biosynthesis
MKALNDYFPEIYCINLDRRPDRWKECQQEFKLHDLNVKRLSAIDSKLLTSSSLLSAAELATLRSHKMVLKLAKSKNYHTIFILEDDVEFHQNLTELFNSYIKEVPDDWDVLFFGANHSGNNIWMEEPLIPLSQHVYKVNKSYSLHSYVVKNTVYDSLIEVLSAENGPCDVLISDIQRHLNCYVFRPPLAWQRPSYSDIQEKFTNYEFLKN